MAGFAMTVPSPAEKVFMSLSVLHRWDRVAAAWFGFIAAPTFWICDAALVPLQFEALLRL